MTYQNIFGIDTSKAEIVVALHGSKQTAVFSNNFDGFCQFYESFRGQLADSLVVIEATGGYEREFQSFLHDGKIASHKASGRQIKNFIRSFGQIAKTDDIDAKAIAQYGYERQSLLRLYEEKSQPTKKLNCLVMRRMDLVQMLVAEKNRKQAPDNKIIRDGVTRHVAFIEGEIKGIEAEIAHCIESDKALAATAKALTETVGIGPKIAPVLMALVPELGSLNRRQAASLCGVAPHPRQSGGYKGYSRTSGGRRQIRPMLYLAAMAASRTKSPLGCWYRGLVAHGKKPLVALVALMRKIIVIANAKVRDAQKQDLIFLEKHS